MISFDQAAHRIARYRICLERDTARGIVAPRVRAVVDCGYADLDRLLQLARIELEGSGSASTAFQQHFLASFSLLVSEVFRTMHRETNIRRIAAAVGDVTARGDRLRKQLWARLEAAA